jgi:hypothetical protein
MFELFLESVLLLGWPLTERHSTMDNGERIPVRPHRFTRRKPTPKVPVRSLALSTSFADCLDGEGLDVVPMLAPVQALVHALPVVEPLSWDSR